MLFLESENYPNKADHLMVIRITNNSGCVMLIKLTF